MRPWHCLLWPFCFVLSVNKIVNLRGKVIKAKNGNTVKIHYTGKFDDGTVFDSSINGEPLEFTLGKGQVIQGFEEAVICMGIDESKSIHVPANKAYGPHVKEMIAVVDRGQIPLAIEPKIGAMLDVRQENGSTISVTIAAISESEVTLDANHPLAGKNLNFDIELVEIKE